MALSRGESQWNTLERPPQWLVDKTSWNRPLKVITQRRTCGYGWCSEEWKRKEREKEWITVVFSSCKLASVQKDALNTHTETACLLLFVIGGWFRQSAWMVYYSEHKYSFVVRTSKKHHKVDGVDTTLNHSLRYGKMWKQIVFPVCLDGRVGERCVSVITLR